MKHFFISLFVTLALITGLMSGVSVAHADPVETRTTTYCDNKNNCDYATQAQADAGTTANIAAQKSADKSANDSKASADEGYDSIMIKIMSLFAWLAGVAMITLNYATYYTVVAMGNFVSNISAIGVTWRILRDIGNIMLIFGFLAIGISVILNVNWYGGKTKMLPMLLVGAIFLNFSLFFTEAIIDTGNLFATQFYKQINGGVMPTVATLGNQGISDKIMSQLGLQTMYGKMKDTEKAKEIFKGGSPWIIGFMGILLFIILAFVLFSLAFILIARFVILIFLIILAPIGFAGLAIPQLAGTAKRWWDTLFEQTITAPVLMLLLYIALNVITDAQFLTGLGNGGRADWLGSVSGTVEGITSFAPVLISFLVAMGLLLAVTISAKKLSAFGANTVSKVGNAAKNSATKFAMSPVRYVGHTAKNAAVGTGKFALRNTAGRGLNWASNKVKTSPNLGTSQVGRLAATALGAAGGKSYVEARDKSVKKHEEYVKSVGAALEEKHAQGILDASQSRDTAASVKEDATKTKNEITTRHNTEDKPFVDEVTRLKKEVADRKASGNMFAQMNAQTELTKAEKDLADHLASLAAGRKVEIDAANTTLKVAEDALKVAKAAEEAANIALKKEKKEAVIGYAQSIPKTPFDGTGGLEWLASGTGGNLASMKILKDAFKVQTEQEKALETLKAFVTPPATPAAAPAPTPAPAKGGTP